MTQLGNAYKISRRVAVGDLAEVLLAAQHGFGGLEKLVVVKRVLPHLRADPHFVQIFIEEARRAAGLKHQNVAEIYDVIYDERDLCVVMEYLAGEDLAFLTRSYSKGELKIPVPIACRIVAQAADGLHYAHTRTGLDGQREGMLHRDLSPGNVVVTYNGVTKLTDFGVARADVQNIYARPATVKLKLAYRSPERIQHKELDERSDVYSLGVLLYELLVGRRLFRGENEASVLKNVMELKVPPPSQLNAEIPPQLDELVLRTIERDPERRVATAQELQQGLDAALAKSKQLVSEHEVHVWLTSSLKARHTERQRMERSVLAEGRDLSRMAATTSELPPMFGGFSGSEVTVTPSATSVSTMVGRASTQPVPIYLGEGANRRSRTLLLSLIASLVTLVIVLTFAFAYWLGRRSPPVDEGLSPVPTEGDRVIVPSSSASLLVHASPGGSALELEGEPISNDVGTEGVLVPVAPNRRVRLTLRKEGLGQRSLVVEAPESGTKHVYLTLAAGATGDAGEASEGSVAGGVDAGRDGGELVKRDADVSRGEPRAKVGRRTTPAKRAPEVRVEARRSARQARTPVPLEVTFSPADARLVIDDVPREGRSPVIVTDLLPGSHRVTVSAPGYETQTRVVELQPGTSAGTVLLRLTRTQLTAPVSIASKPSGATVTINGRYQGKTPLSGLRLPSGQRYRVEVSLPGYRLWSGELKVDPDTASSIDATLIKDR